MKILVTGASGQLARELELTVPTNVELISASKSELDISDLASVRAYLDRYSPNAIINAAAYTAVDKAEEDVERAYAVNQNGPANLAQASANHCYVLHVSTDFVFDGTRNTPYRPDDAPAPQSVYGKSKCAGEIKLAEHKASNWAIIRTSWVYSVHGSNFVKSMLRYMAERPELNIVVDQVGSPTWAKGLAQVCWQAVANGIQGIYHWSDAGVASWYDFAEVIQSLGLEYGLLDATARLNAIPTEAYPLPATRPAYSVLDKSKILKALPELKNLHWQKQLRSMFDEMKRLSNS